MLERQPYKLYMEPGLSDSCLIVGWAKDGGRIGSKLVEYLARELRGHCFAEIEPVDFFPLGGVTVEDDVAEFPEARFYCCRDSNLVLFHGDLPACEWHRYLDSILEVAQQYCNAREIYTVGGMFSLSPHTAPRQMFAIAGSPDMKQYLSRYGLAGDFDHDTPPGQRPTLSSFLLWEANRRGVAGAGLWTSVPFYLAAVEDPAACRKPLEFLNTRFKLGIDFSELDAEIARVNDLLARARSTDPQVDGYVQKLESNLALAEQELEALAAKIEDYFKRERL
ncbi:MAG: hypothetical protein DRI39_02015 [Chloroflexi bacterium]|nr:MAG: hypothetical protein DRI39_02015 [Chloroflexota bacterium]